MTLLYIYLGTTAASYTVCRIYAAACVKRLKRKGYKLVKKEESFVEKLSSFLSTAFKTLLPVYNVINAVAVLCMGEKVYDHIEKQMLERGEIYKPVDELEKINAENQASQNKENTMNEAIKHNNEDKPVASYKTIRTYNEESLDETKEQGPVLRMSSSFNKK